MKDIQFEVFWDIPMKICETGQMRMTDAFILVEKTKDNIQLLYSLWNVGFYHLIA